MSIPPPPPPGPYDGQQPLPGGYPPPGGPGGGYPPPGQYPAAYGAPGPYGAPGSYGGGPAGWYPPPPRRTNPMAITSLVLSVACGLPLVGMIFGLVALSQIRKRGDDGKGMAIAGIVISAVTTLLFVIVIALGLAGYLDEDTATDSTGVSETTDLQVGDCFNTNGSVADYEDEGGGPAPWSVTVVPCPGSHDAETFAVFDLADGDYPGDSQVGKLADDGCGTGLDSYLDVAELKDTMEMYYYVPQASGWGQGDREVTCFLSAAGGPTTGRADDPLEASGQGV